MAAATRYAWELAQQVLKYACWTITEMAVSAVLEALQDYCEWTDVIKVAVKKGLDAALIKLESVQEEILQYCYQSEMLMHAIGEQTCCNDDGLLFPSDDEYDY